MSCIKKYVVFCFVSSLFIASFNLFSHNAKIATYRIHKANSGEWTLTVSVPFSALHSALLTKHSESERWMNRSEENVSKKKTYNAGLAIAYLQQFSRIQVNHKDITLKNISYKMDEHQSNFTFVMADVPAIIKRFDFNVSAMSENKGHMNFVRIKTSKGMKRVVLQHRNNYKSYILL